MGNCATLMPRKKTRKQGDDGQDGDSNGTRRKEAAAPGEDVTYATIDHGNAKTPATVRSAGDDDCDYAIVTLPPQRVAEAEDDCADDYVLMG